MSGWSRTAKRRAHGASIRRFLPLCAVLVGLLAVPGGAQGAASAGPPFRDLPRAQAELDAARQRLTDAETAMADAQAELTELQQQQAEAHGQDAELATAYEAQRTLARRLVIEAYMGDAGVTDSAALLDTAEAGDLTFRLELLEAHSENVLAQSGLVVEMRNGVSDNALELAAAQDEIVRRIESLQGELDVAARLVADAEWAVEIASIHAEADVEMAERGRTEPTAEQWAQLRWCESRGNYAIDTGNGYYGAYQFDLVTWRGTGGYGNPAQMPPEEQDARARLLYSWRGWVPWPICGQYLPQS